jgi:hypothetical protein
MTARSFARSRRSFGLSSVVIAMFTGATLAGGCEGNPEGEPVAEIQSALSNIDMHRSLVVTEQPILAGFTFKRVMQQLVGQSGVPRLTALELWRQLWDTQNPKPGLGLGANCDTQQDAFGNPVINDYPYVCRTAFEGREVDVDPFTKPGKNPAEYIPIGLFNRFDLAPENGAHCGEHRIVFARRSGITEAANRNLLIFEFNLRNPRPAEGLGGCREIVQFWADLSTLNDLSARAKKLEGFYFGTDAHGPVVHINNLGLNSLGVGQIRTNSLMGFATTSPKVWMMREFQLSTACSTAAARCLKAVPVTVKTNPFGPLFSSAVSSPPRQAEFQQAFIETEVARLAASTLGGIDFKVADSFNTAQSVSSGSTENNYVSQLGTSGAFHAAIQAKLTAIGSGLLPEHIAARAQALSCAGCHRLNARAKLDDPSTPDPALNPDLGGGLTWPASLGFVHVAENLTDTEGGVTRFRLSPALHKEFLPARKRVMDEYLDNRRTAGGGPTDPIGGRRVH